MAVKSEQLDKKLALVNARKCDKYDYLIAVASGAVAGLVDIFLVGAPGDSVLGNWSDAQVDKAVMSFAKLSCLKQKILKMRQFIGTTQKKKSLIKHKRPQIIHLSLWEKKKSRCGQVLIGLLRCIPRFRIPRL